MILKGNQRGGAKDLALHLMKEENERVEVHDIRGFASDTLMGALNESYALSRSTQCKQHMFSLSLNPPKDANVTNEEFEEAIARVEDKLGLTGQPRAIVFHEKEGPSGMRRHCHAVWSRIKAEECKAVQLSYTHNKLQELSRELYIEKGWKMPRGLANKDHADPRNFTLAQWQQAKRIGKDARQMKGEFQDAWAISDSKAAFVHALEERGYKLAQGDRRGFVAVDHHGEIYSISKWSNIEPKQIKARLGDPKDLPSVAETKALYAQEMLSKIQHFQQETDTQEAEKKRRAEIEKQRLEAEQKAKREALAHALKLRRQAEEQARQARLRKGLIGVVDRITGKRKKTHAENEAEKKATFIRDKQEKTAIIIEQKQERKRFVETQEQRQAHFAKQKTELKEDAERFREMKETSQQETKEQSFKQKRRTPTSQRPKRRPHNRGPTLGM